MAKPTCCHGTENTLCGLNSYVGFSLDKKYVRLERRHTRLYSGCACLDSRICGALVICSDRTVLKLDVNDIIRVGGSERMLRGSRDDDGRRVGRIMNGSTSNLCVDFHTWG